MACTTKTYMTKDMGWSNHVDIRNWIEKQAHIHGGAWAYDEMFGQVTVVTADVPSRLPDFYIALSKDSLYFKGTWREFSTTAKLREQQRGLGRG